MLVLVAITFVGELDCALASLAVVGTVDSLTVEARTSELL